MGTLSGQHLCKVHQGNHSHYDKQNCVICIQAEQIANLQAELNLKENPASEQHERDTAGAATTTTNKWRSLCYQKEQEVLDLKTELLRVGAASKPAAEQSQPDPVPDLSALMVEHGISVELQHGGGWRAYKWQGTKCLVFPDPLFLAFTDPDPLPAVLAIVAKLEGRTDD